MSEDTLSKNCNTLQHTATYLQSILVPVEESLQNTLHATDCNRLQQTAIDCNRPAVHSCSRGRETAKHYITLQHNATHYTTPAVHPRSRRGKTAARCSKLQHIAEHCNILQHTCSPSSFQGRSEAPSCIHNTLQHTATHLRSILVPKEERLQHAAAHCNTLQYTCSPSSFQRRSEAPSCMCKI